MVADLGVIRELCSLYDANAADYGKQCLHRDLDSQPKQVVIARVKKVFTPALVIIVVVVFCDWQVQRRKEDTISIVCCGGSRALLSLGTHRDYLNSCFTCYSCFGGVQKGLSLEISGHDGYGEGSQNVFLIPPEF